MNSTRIVVPLLLAVLGVAVVGFGLFFLSDSRHTWTPEPLTAAPSQTAFDEALTHATPVATLLRSTSTPIPPTAPGSIPIRTVRPSLPPASTSTRDPHLIVVTEKDIMRLFARGAGSLEGVQLDDLGVRFSDGKMRLTASRLNYGALGVQNLELVGRLVARDGLVQLDVESISPRGLAAAVLPAMINQALAKYGSSWYVEEIRTREGRLELRIR